MRTATLTQTPLKGFGRLSSAPGMVRTTIIQRAGCRSTLPNLAGSTISATTGTRSDRLCAGASREPPVLWRLPDNHAGNAA
ncbi:MAG: hypothetical protein OXC62_17555 [Aestuariivita sp.]|nr:hypothetical protein [Aestuariivita sp.]